MTFGVSMRPDAWEKNLIAWIEGVVGAKRPVPRSTPTPGCRSAPDSVSAALTSLNFPARERRRSTKVRRPRCGRIAMLKPGAALSRHFRSQRDYGRAGDVVHTAAHDPLRKWHSQRTRSRRINLGRVPALGVLRVPSPPPAVAIYSSL